MTDTGKLAEALAAFQGEAPTVHKDKTATVPTKSGGQYKYSYADLADVAAAAYPILARHGLSFSCAPGIIDGKPVVRGILMHSSGESIEGMLPMPGSTPQEIGSSLTYARRYLLGCLTGIVTDADDDGALASGAKRPPRKPAEPAPRHSPRPAEVETGELITPAQMRKLHATLGDLGLHDDRDEALRQIGGIIGRQLDSTKDLTVTEASKVIDQLNNLTKSPEGPGL